MTPIEETLEALSELVRAGKVRYIGHSNFSGLQTARAADAAQALGAVPFVSAQNHWSLLERAAELDVVPAAHRVRPGRPAVLPAGQRSAHRENPPRPACRRGHPAGRPRRLRDRGQAGQGGEPRGLGGPARPHRCWMWLSARWPRSPAAHRSSPAPPRPSRSGPTPRPREWEPAAAELAEIDKIVPAVYRRGLAPARRAADAGPGRQARAASAPGRVGPPLGSGRWRRMGLRPGNARE